MLMKSPEFLALCSTGCLDIALLRKVSSFGNSRIRFQPFFNLRVITPVLFSLSRKFSDIMTTDDRTCFGKNFDIAFIFPENGGATIFAEKQKLVNKSEVFEKQLTFSSPTSATDDEAAAERIPRIEIKDISFDIFKMMMEHIYGTTIVINEENYSELLYASRKYFIDDLTQKVIEFLGKFINAKNIAEHFECIDRYEIKMLNDILKNVCIAAPLEVIGCLTCSTPHKRIQKMILKSPILPCSEFKLHNAIVEMLKRQDNIDKKDFRKKLGNLIYLIRFPTMTVPELVLCAKKPSLLTTVELIAFQLWVQEKIFSNTLQFFTTVPRLKIETTGSFWWLNAGMYEKVTKKSRHSSNKKFTK